MMRTFQMMLWICVVFIAAGPALAQEPIVFPAKGQSQEQMERDKFSCYEWAKNESGFDPMKPPPAMAPPPQPGGGLNDTFKGAALGAGAGALIKRKGSRSKGAMTGALIGGVLGGISDSSKRRRERHRYEDYERQQANAYAAKRGTYNRAFEACMEGKGYTVK